MMKPSNFHYSVMLNEIIDTIPIIENGIYVDCTLGMGGYSTKIIDKIPKSATLVCIDKDQFAIDNFKKIIDEKNINNVILIKDDFKNLRDNLKKHNINEIDWIVYDLGVSSPQLDNADRGFSFQKDGPLDMRMDRDQKITAWDIVNNYPYERLFDIFRKYSESKFSSLIANNIVKYREVKKIDTTLELVDVIKSCLPKKVLSEKKHPAKVFFQAIRIEVNQELSFLEDSIITSANLLKKNGILNVITFHSLEDKIVKESFKKLITSSLPHYIPIEHDDVEFEAKKSIKPSIKELSENNRSKSAKLRTIKRKEKYEK